MDSKETLLKQFDAILDKLIDNAEKLLEASKQVVSPEELELLQKKQETLLTSLLEKDAAYHDHPDKSETDIEKALHYCTNEKLTQFQNLNARFIENITFAKNLIQLNQDKPKKTKKKD